MKIEHLEVFNFEGAFRGMRNPMNSWDKSDSWFDISKKYNNHKYDLVISKWINHLNDYRINKGKKPIWSYTEKYDKVALNYLSWLFDSSVLRSCKEDPSLADVALLGPKDLELAQKLILAGNEHRKFLRQIIISFDLTAPLYFWKEFDTYKIGTTSNSTSTMHKLAKTPITLDCFETDDYDPDLVYLQGIDDHGDNWYTYNMCVKDMVEAFGMDSYNEPTIIQFLEELRLAYLETKDKRYWKELIRWLPESWLQTRTITMSYENVLSIIHQRSSHKLSEWRWLVEEFKKLPYAYELLYFTLDEKEGKDEN